MVCDRCKMVVRSALEALELNPIKVDLGEVEIQAEPDKLKLEHTDAALKKLGFELIDDRKSRIIEKIKNCIVHLIHHSGEHLKVNFSDYLSAQLNYDYNYLSALFSELEGRTIEKYLISQKIERVKELLVYRELTLSEIADDLGYSSVAHLSNQFKKITGLTPTHFKNLTENRRSSISDL